MTAQANLLVQARLRFMLTTLTNMAQSQSPLRRNICGNPFNNPSHFIRKKNQLRLVTKWKCDKASILPGERICRMKLVKATTLQIPDSCSVSDSESQGSVASLSDELHQISKTEIVVAMNDFSGKIGRHLSQEGSYKAKSMQRKMWKTDIKSCKRLW